MSVTRDSTSLWYCPASSAEWTEFLSGSAIGMPVGTWGMQETIGDFVDVISGFNLVDASMTHSMVVPGWTRKGMGCSTDGSGANAVYSAGAAGDIGLQSHLFFAFVYLPLATVLADGGFMGMGLSTAYRYIALNTAGTLKLGNLDGSAIANSTTNVVGLTVAIALRVNRTAGNYSIILNGETVSQSPYTAPSTAGTGLVFGNALSGSPKFTTLYAALWRGASAEMNDPTIRKLYSMLSAAPARGPSIATTVAIDAEDGATVAYEFATDIIRPLSGKEAQRLSLRAAPRETYRFSATMSDATCASIQSAMVKDAALGSAFGVGVVSESLRVANDSVVRSWSKSPSIEVGTSVFSDWIASGQRATIISPDNTRQWDGIIQGGVTDTDYPWTMTKNAGGADAWDAGASSVQSISGNGYVEHRVGVTSTLKMIGFSATDPDQNYFTIGFAAYLKGLEFSVYEAGTCKLGTDTGGAAGPTCSVGDIIRVERVGTTITYKLNGTIIYTSLVSSSGPLYVDTSLFHSTTTPRSALFDIRLIDAGVAVSLQWKNVIGVTMTGTGGVTTGTSPSSAADMASAVRWGTWTNGWKLGSPVVSPMAPLYGGQSLSQSWGVYAKPGPFGAGSYAHEFSGQADGGSGAWVAANNTVLNPGVTEDFACAIIFKAPILKASEFCRVFVKSAFTAGQPYYQLGLYGPDVVPQSIAMSWQVGDGVGNFSSSCKYYPGQWCAAICIVDRTKGICSVVSYNLETGEVSEGAQGNVATMGTIANTGTFGLAAWQDTTIDRPLFQVESFHVSQGVKAARGLSENMTAAIRNLAECVFPHRIPLNTLNGNLPPTAEAMKVATGGLGTWTHGWKFDESSTAVAKNAFGGVDLVVSAGTATGGNDGLLGSGDYALQWPTGGGGTGNWNDNDTTRFDVGATEDLAVLALVRFGTLPAAGTYGTILGKVTGGFTNGWTITGTNGVGGYIFAAGPGGGGTGTAIVPSNPDGYHVGEWHILLASWSRAIGQIAVSTRSLATGKAYNSAPQGMGVAAVSAPGVVFSVGSGAWVLSNQDMKIGALYIAKGVGAATGLTRNHDRAMEAFHRYILPPAGSRIMPAMPSLLGAQGVALHPVNAGAYRLEARAVYFGDANGAWTPKPALHIVEYKPFLDTITYPVWTRRPIVSGTSARAVQSNVELLDRGNAIKNVPLTAFSDFDRELIVRVNDDSERQFLKMFIGKVAGQRKAFLLPTWKPDLLPITGDASGGILVIRSQTNGGIDFAGKYLASPAHRVLMFQCANGSIVYRTVSDATDNLNGTQTLQLDSAVTGTTVSVASFAEKCRFNTDTFSVSYQNALGLCRIPVRVVQR